MGGKLTRDQLALNVLPSLADQAKAGSVDRREADLALQVEVVVVAMGMEPVKVVPFVRSAPSGLNSDVRAYKSTIFHRKLP
jgi:hypothetical protein